MKDERYQKVWHFLNAACAEVVVGSTEVAMRDRRMRLVMALEQARAACKHLTDLLSEKKGPV